MFTYMLDKSKIETCDYSEFVGDKPKHLSTYELSEELLNFNINQSKIALLLTTSDKCKKSTISFDPTDVETFATMRQTIYSNCAPVQQQDMIKNFYQILIEQSIVSVVSSWECYFSDIIEHILNDTDFIEKLKTDTDTFDKFIKKFNIRSEIFGSEPNGIGTYLLEKKKINCQNTDHVKDFFKFLFEINIINVDPQSWNSVYNLFEDRHSIIHNRNDTTFQKYDKDKIQKISKAIYGIIKEVDKKLFTFLNEEK